MSIVSVESLRVKRQIAVVSMWSHAIWSSAYAASLAQCYVLHAGCRQWNSFRRWITANIDESLTAWFGRVEVVRDGHTEFDPQRRYMFGYSPHGLFPIGMHLHFCSRTSFLCHSQRVYSGVTALNTLRQQYGSLFTFAQHRCGVSAADASMEGGSA